jgi:hypothetical protein
MCNVHDIFPEMLLSGGPDPTKGNQVNIFEMQSDCDNACAKKWAKIRFLPNICGNKEVVCCR